MSYARVMGNSNPDAAPAAPDEDGSQRTAPAEDLPGKREDGPKDARAGKVRSSLPPRGQRPLGHLERRQETVKLPSRTGWFYTSGMWGSFAFDVLFRTLIGIYAGFFLTVIVLIQVIGVDYGAGHESAIDQHGILALLWGLLPWFHVLVLNFRLKAKPEYRSRNWVGPRAMLWGMAYALLGLAV